MNMLVCHALFGQNERVTNLESLPVLGRHDVVEDGVDGGGAVVEAAGDVVHVLVDVAIVGQLLAVDVEEALSVVRREADEKPDHNRHWNSRETQR